MFLLFLSLTTYTSAVCSKIISLLNEDRFEVVSLVSFSSRLLQIAFLCSSTILWFSNICYSNDPLLNKTSFMVFQINFSSFSIIYHVTFIRPLLSQTKNLLVRNTFASLRCHRRRIPHVQMIKFITLTKIILTTVCSCFYFCVD